MSCLEATHEHTRPVEKPPFSYMCAWALRRAQEVRPASYREAGGGLVTAWAAGCRHTVTLTHWADSGFSAGLGFVEDMTRPREPDDLKSCLEGWVAFWSDHQTKWERDEHRKRSEKWRAKAEAEAAKGSSFAFGLLRKADNPLPVELHGGGTAETLREEEDKWGKLWQAQADVSADLHFARDLERAGMVPAPELISPERFREASRSFAKGTSCSDALPLRCFALLSDEALRALARVVRCFDRLGRWPEAMAIVFTVLIPKASGGVRPIALFRGLPRLLARIRADPVKKWFAQNAPPVATRAWAGESATPCG